MATFPSIKISSFVLILSCSAFVSQAAVPQNQTFRFVLDGDFGPYIVEYDAGYQMLDIFTSPFQLAFYNTTPNAFTLAIRMGLRRSEQLFRWVWEANRGNPVGQNATFSFGTDGNLVLADADGTIAWQTNTANKDVVGFKLLPNGNMVLHDARGNFVWQSFDHPTDTLLVGQSLRVGGGGGPSKLVSRLSKSENVDGPYSLVLEPRGLALYYKSKNSPRPSLYFFSYRWYSPAYGSLDKVTFQSDPETYDLELEFQVAGPPKGHFFSTVGRPTNNSTLTYLRLGMDGNIRVHTYYVSVRQGVWEETYTLFAKGSDETECQLPEKCGELGLCEDNQCIACPLSSGLLGWSKSCKPEAVTSCRPNDFHYYKLEGVDHYMSRYGTGAKASERDCGQKCTKDCKCLGYFYNKGTSRCWVAYDLKTLTKVENSTLVGYIKVPSR